MAYKEEPIAVIGSGCRFPGGSSSPSKLWDLLKSPRDVASKIDRFSADGFYHKDGSHHGTSNVLHSYQIEEDTRLFDAQFFNIPGSEAESMDPQQRVLMEVTYEALEASGRKIEELSGSPTAVYVGVMCNDYAHITYHDIESLPKYAATGTALSILSNRLSYFFNWTGPSMTIDTACSSSLIATHHAVQSLRRGESNLAVAAGANLIFGPTNYVAESNVNMLSPTGRSRMWDKDADGYARGEGVAAIILKRLSDAIADGDPIDCVIRETSANQDGRTPGITMPSATSQAQLIRQTYARAGLDIEKDRCQYFEAHGTGTKAGDPQEASAIYKAFFADNQAEQENPLYVGSIKTIIGHTEGTAGIAGLLRASLAIKNGTIPPNMLFNNLNEDIVPYYGKLQITTAPREWPQLPAGVPRRASVNSFGFGGANAHAIIEGYEPNTANEAASRSSLAAIPFLLSANSEKTLANQVETYLAYLEDLDEDAANLRDLSWTLSRRSAFSLRTAYSAQTLEDLRGKMRAALESKKNGDALGVRPSHKNHTVMGIFTGQGAQWPRMGYRLVEASPFAAAILESLDASLQALPEQDRPSWSLRGELAKPAEDSHVMEGTYSQPLCAAVQIILVSLLKEAGVTFDVVVGHSSGEIGAAFAAGFLSAEDAIRVAYYRGLYGKLAAGPEGKPGSMMAVGTSMDDADELAGLSTMKRYGRFNVAASNSSASVTLSGDNTAIERAKFILEDESKFVRALKVDTAYHSHHMQPCSEPYMDAMSRVKVTPLKGSDTCKWYSSVLGGDLVTSDMADQLAGSYWRDNLLQPVLFSQALETALQEHGTAALALEVGPHPALKGPASLVMEEAVGASIPYSGVLGRNSDDVEAFSAAIGAAWSRVGTSSIAFGQLDAAFVPPQSNDVVDKPRFLRSAPGYAWDHSHTFWAESRLSKTMRLRPHMHNELLGVRLDSGDNEMRWRNFLKPNEIPWVRGHQIQGQTIFPGAGFASMAIEAAKALASDAGKAMQLVELQDLTIHRALGFNDEIVGAEVTIALGNIQRDEAAGTVHCDFVCGACPSKDAPPSTISTAGIRIRLGHGVSSADALPPRDAATLEQDMTDVESEIFYNSLAKLGYNYVDMFKGITSLRRKGLNSSGGIRIDAEASYEKDLILHPAPLDVAFQGLFGAIGAPGDGQLWTLMVPTVIKSIKVDPAACDGTSCLDTELSFDARVAIDRAAQSVSGDIDVYSASGSAVMQIEGLHVTPVVPITADDDAQKFSQTIWADEKPDAAREYTQFWEAETEKWEKSYFVERACFLYMKRLYDAIPMDERDELAWHPKKYLNWVTSVVDAVNEGTHPIIKKEWLNDTLEEMEGPMKEFSKEYEDFSHLMTLGSNLVPFIRGEVSPLEIFRDTDVLDHVYKHTYGVGEYNNYLGSLVEQLVHKSKHMEIFEIGAGTGSAAEAIMSRIGDHFGSYTYTDISAGFFPQAQELFKKQSAKFTYKTFDAEAAPADQGFVERKYDLVIASNVLHATRSIEGTLANVRRLLKPGGHLVLLEITDVEPVRPSFFFGSLPGWWVGEDDGRPHHPLLPQSGWDAALRNSGFSGIESATPESGIFIVPLSVMLSQAVDPQMELIRQPLAPSPTATTLELPKLLVLAGLDDATAQVQSAVLKTLEPYTTEVEVVSQIEDFDERHFGTKQLLLSFMELDTPVFGPFTPERWRALQLMTEKSGNILWLTRGVAGENPYSNMMVGMSRCLVHEKPDLRFQVVDFPAGDEIDVSYVASTLLRMQVSADWKNRTEPYVTAWQLEREIRYVDGKVYVPRMAPCRDLDARYNASRRPVREVKSIEDSTVAVSEKYGPLELREVKNAATDGGVQVETLRSTLSPLRIPSVGSLYLVLGRVINTQQLVLAFSDTVQSKVSVSQDNLVHVDAQEEQFTDLLVSAANFLLGEYLLSKAEQGVPLTVHEPTAALGAALKQQAQCSGVSVRLTTSAAKSNGLQYVHPRAHARTIANLFTAKSAFAYLPDAEDAACSGTYIAEHLPSHVSTVAPANFFAASASFDTRSPSTDAAVKALTGAQAFASRTSSSERVREFTLANVQGHSRDTANFSIDVLNLSTEKTALCKLLPAEDEVQFKADKTYWLAGLTGELGLSLTRWMIERGARHIVMTSRNPKVSQEWLEATTKPTGAVVKALPMDITSEDAVVQTYNTIVATLPPIAGVCNGAMVLNDSLIANQSYEDFNATLEPKVKGTQYLNKLFPSDNLDFFIIFSSLAYTTGNLGQASYASANAFMASVVEGRRRRGLAGSIMNMAGIYGIGYITRREATLMDRLEKMGYSNISEWDYLQFFAEAVLAGKPGSGYDFWDISSAFKQSDPDAENPPPWLDVPRFSWYKTVKTKAVSQDDGEVVSVREQMKEQTTMEDVRDVLLRGFIGNLYKLLGMQPEDNGISPSTPLIELGIDSLVAVDMRIWFTRELDLDLPVLKLLSGATVEDMVEDATARLNPALIPNVKDAQQAPEAETQDDSSSQGEGSEDAETTPTSIEPTPEGSEKGDDKDCK